MASKRSHWRVGDEFIEPAEQDTTAQRPPTRGKRKGSDRETEMIRWYRERHAPDRKLIWEYQVVKPSSDRTGRWIDAVILRDEEGDETWATEPVDGKHVIVVQAKVRRLSMSLLGQTYFSMRLLEEICGATVTEAVALCGKPDSALEDIARRTDARLRVLSRPEVPAEHL